MLARIINILILVIDLYIYGKENMDSLPLNRRQQKEKPGFQVLKLKKFYDAPVRGRTGGLRGFKME